MLIETPEYLALVAEHKNTCELGVKLKTDLEAVTAEKVELSAKLSEAQNKLQEADKAITELKASMEKTAAEHAAALSDFDKKVADKAAMTLAASGTQPVVLGSSGTTDSDAELYDTFKKADPITSKQMLEDPAKGPRIRLESQRRHK